MSLNQKTYRAILVYFWFLLGLLLIFCVFAAVLGPDWNHGNFIKFATLSIAALAGVGGFILTIGKLKTGTPWGYGVWFFTCWMVGINVFFDKSSPRNFEALSDVFSSLLEKLIFYSVIGVLPYVCVKLFSWLRLFISTGTGPFESHNKSITSAASITCHNCQTTNQPGASFCGGCGAVLPKEERCQHCNALRQSGHKFCDSCGKLASST
jgi:hypothetical protein